MIRSVRSSLPTFHAASFSEGMNIVLADTAKDSEETESTNGLGKTTLLRIIHFCLGGMIARDKVLSHPQLSGISFGITFIYQGQTIDVDRSTDKETVTVTASFLDGLGVERVARSELKETISVEDWRLVLSARFLPDAKVEEGAGYAPSFREVFIYLSRLGKLAYSDPQSAFQAQSGSSKRLIVSYLLGLNWRHQRQLEQEIQKRTQVNAAIKALEDARDSTDDQTIGDLEAERVVLEKQIGLKQIEVANFSVRQDYHDLESNLNFVDQKLHDLVNENHSDARLLEYYTRSAKEIPDTPVGDPLVILRDAGAIFKDEALRSLEEVAEFHRQVYHNRSEFLAVEIARLKKAIESRSERINSLSIEKTTLLRVLKSSGALEALIELQRGLSNLESAHVSLKGRIDERKRFDRRKDEISGSIIETRSLLKRDLEDRRQIVDEAVGLFAEYTRFLYGVPGLLVVDVKNSGYSFGVSIEREGSDGVDQMVVFCFDLTVATLRARRSALFGTLIHDSSMFADVDPRQYGLALQLANMVAQQEGFQYICCLNAGAMPTEHLGALTLDELVKLRLDDSEGGRLLGIRLPPKEQR